MSDVSCRPTFIPVRTLTSFTSRFSVQRRLIAYHTRVGLCSLCKAQRRRVPGTRLLYTLPMFIFLVIVAVRFWRLFLVSGKAALLVTLGAPCFHNHSGSSTLRLMRKMLAGQHGEVLCPCFTRASPRTRNLTNSKDSRTFPWPHKSS